MASRRSGGYRAPSDYDPRRGRKGRAGSKKPDPGKSGTGTTPSSRSNETGASPISRREGPDTGGRRSANPANSAGAALPPLAALPAPLEARVTRPEDVADIGFAELGLGGNIVRALAELGATAPFPIQAATIPDALAGHHVLGRGRTGSGKTIAFGAALVERLLRLKAEGAFPGESPREKPKRGERQQRPARTVARPPKALILAPTRELALQIDRTVQPLARSVGFYTAQLVGGQPFEPQLHALKRGADIVIGTPGRIEDLAGRGHLDLGRVAVTVIDEADHMAELGFIEAVQRVLRLTRRGGQRLLFSATLDRGVDALVGEFMPRPAVHEVRDGTAHGDADATSAGDRRVELPPNVEHRVLIVLREHKDAALIELARGGGRVLVFCRTRAYTERVTELLTETGIRAVPLHGDLAQAKRERNLARFAEGRAEVLVATDVAARGIHVDDIDLVLQADPPDDPKAYVHRAGRTGRVDRPGRVLTVIPRTRQKRTRELFAQLGLEADFFGDFVPEGAA